MSDQLTIVLTLKDRDAFTRRWMRYMNDVACRYPILIADGGSSGEIETLLSQPGSFPALRYQYVRYPRDYDHRAYYLKHADIVSRVTTPYVLLADNDDFFLLDAIPACIATLEQRRDAVSCGGRPVILRLLAEDGSVSTEAKARRYTAWPDERPKNVEGEDAATRIGLFMREVQQRYLWSSWYQVHRTPAVQRTLALVPALDFHDPVTHEIHLHLGLLAAGNYLQLDCDSMVTQQGSSQLTAQINTRANLVERFRVAGALADVPRSLDAIAPAMATADRDRCLAAVDAWFAEVTARLETGVATPPATPKRITLPRLERYILS